MNRKYIITILVTGLLTFSLSWYFFDMKQFADGVIADRFRVDSLETINTGLVPISQDYLDSLMVVSNMNGKSENFSKKIRGRFFMKGADCAGFNFISPSLISWTNEIFCHSPDTLMIRWLDNVTFYTKDIIRMNENCPPRVSIYQVISYDGVNLVLKDIWTGWERAEEDNKTKYNERIEFIKRDL